MLSSWITATKKTISRFLLLAYSREILLDNIFICIQLFIIFVIGSQQGDQRSPSTPLYLQHLGDAQTFQHVKNRRVLCFVLFITKCCYSTSRTGECCLYFFIIFITICCYSTWRTGECYSFVFLLITKCYYSTLRTGHCCYFFLFVVVFFR